MHSLLLPMYYGGRRWSLRLLMHISVVALVSYPSPFPLATWQRSFPPPWVESYILVPVCTLCLGQEVLESVVTGTLGLMDLEHCGVLCVVMGGTGGVPHWHCVCGQQEVVVLAQSLISDIWLHFQRCLSFIFMPFILLFTLFCFPLTILG